MKPKTVEIAIKILFPAKCERDEIIMSRDGIICEGKTGLYSVKKQFNFSPIVIQPEMLHCVTR